MAVSLAIERVLARPRGDTILFSVCLGQTQRLTFAQYQRPIALFIAGHSTTVFQGMAGASYAAQREEQSNFREIQFQHGLSPSVNHQAFDLPA
jgi:hypothetical protein